MQMHAGKDQQNRVGKYRFVIANFSSCVVGKTIFRDADNM
jgi:hypothetical protein